jgi:hypothetical protein
VNETKTLGDALPEEIKRVTEILGHYQAIGPAGMFGAMMIKASLQRATRALAEGDALAMIQCLEDLKEYSE